MTLVLIGLPGAGKTTVGKAVAEALQVPFFDCDDAVVQDAGMEIPAIFAREGENGFRQRETRCLTRLLKRENCVIAAGGGAVLSAENRRALQRARVAFLDRSVEDIMLTFEAEGRPMMMGHTLQQLADERRNLYLESADIVVSESVISREIQVLLRYWRDAG